jgi:hypothetical protein
VITRFGIKMSIDPLDTLLGPLQARAEKEKARRDKRAAQPKKKRKKPEDIIHEAIAKLFCAIFARPGIATADGVLWLSTENKPRSMRSGVANRRRGVIGGDSDVTIYYQQKAYKGEIKNTKKYVMQDSQVALHPQLRKAGVPVNIWFSAEDAYTSVVKWGIPHRTARF